MSSGASASTQRALDPEQGISPVLGEAELLGKAEGVAPKPGWKHKDRKESKEADGG